MPRRERKIFERHGSLEAGHPEYWALRVLRSERGKVWREKHKFWLEIPKQVELTPQEREIWLKTLPANLPPEIKKKLELRNKLVYRREMAQFRDYQRHFNLLKQKIPKVLLEKKTRTMALENLRKLKSLKTLVERKESKLYSAKTGRELRKRGIRTRILIPQRFENIARVLSQLSRKNMFVGAEALLGENPFEIRKRMLRAAKRTDFAGFGPQSMTTTAIGTAEYETNWKYEAHTYNCIVFFDENAFAKGVGGWGIQNWGAIKTTEHDPVLAVQLFDPHPKALLDFAKAMAKCRPNNPFPIIDLYGNVFYP